MGGKAHSSSMGDTLTVRNDEIRINAEGLEGRQQTRNLPKGEEAGNVGECYLCTAYAVIEDFEIRKAQHDTCRNRPFTAETDIDAAYPFNGSEHVAPYHTRAKPFLNRPRL